jgi:hypothetical protein
MTNEELCIASYEKHKNLKIVGSELNIPWQTVYVFLRNAGVPVTGDKLRYGSDSDRLAASAERSFLELVPRAVDQNRNKFQSKIDFTVNGYGVDVKAANRKVIGKSKVGTWPFSIKKQEIFADFFVCFAMDNDGKIKHTLLIPAELSKNYSTIRIGDGEKSINGKWWDYLIDKDKISDFFDSLPPK